MADSDGSMMSESDADTNDTILRYDEDTTQDLIQSINVKLEVIKKEFNRFVYNYNNFATTIYGTTEELSKMTDVLETLKEQMEEVNN